MTLPPAYQSLSYRIWDEILRACDAYFLRQEPPWAGDSRAPEFTDDQVERQFAHWDGYRQDSGAMHWRTNGAREFVYDFTALPPDWKRAVCERVWVLCDEAGLRDDPAYREQARRLAAGPASG